MKPNFSPGRGAGFTTVELLAIVVVLGVLGLVMISSLAGTRADLGAVQCRNNLQRLTAAWTMYAGDNRGSLVYNQVRLGSGAGSEQSWVGGWLDFSASSDNTNVALLIDHDAYPNCAYLGPYLRTARVFKCPEDRSTVRIAGARLPRVRSVALNNHLGGRSSSRSPGRQPALLLTNVMQVQHPDRMFVMLDERADSIDDGEFTSDPNTRWQLVEWPGSYHNGSGNFSFVDGHTETHRWKDPRTTPPLTSGNLLPLNVNMPRNVDVTWLQHRAAGVTTPP